jgi:hypothetical protein
VRRASLAGLAAAGVATILLALNGILPGPVSQGPMPPATGSPTPSGPPAPTTSQPPPPLIPDRAFVSGADTFAGNGTPEDRVDPVLPHLCGAVFAGSEDLVSTRGVQSYYQVDPADQFLEGTIDLQIWLFSGDGATRFMDSVRAAVAQCPTEVDEFGTRLRFVERDVALPGDESYTFVASGRFELYDEHFLDREDPYHVVRVGDAVLVLAIRSWEGRIPDEQRAQDLRDRAVQRFTEWADSHI